MGINDVFIGNELDEFIKCLAKTIIKHNISIDGIQRCLPIMAALCDKGISPDIVLIKHLKKRISDNQALKATGNKTLPSP